MPDELTPTRFAVLRDGPDWPGVRHQSVQAEIDGVLVLARVPGPADGQPMLLPGPYDTQPSGLALGACQETYLSDGDARQVVRLDDLCQARTLLRGFAMPRGVLVGPPGGLYVADADASRVLVYRLPTLELRATWTAGLIQPTGLAADDHGRVYVLDRGRSSVLRFSAWGRPDQAYNAQVATALQGTTPAFLAVSREGLLYVADEQANRVLRLDAEGQPQPALAASPGRPRCMTVTASRLYVADASDGSVWAFDLAADAYLGQLPAFRGPVAAMAVDERGRLVLKPGPGEDLVRLAADAGHVAAGWLMAGPLDAGQDDGWQRVHVNASTPAGTRVLLETFVSDDPTRVPGAADWTTQPALDSPLPTPNVGASGEPLGRRFAFVRVRLATAEWQTSPRLHQVEAETRAEGYLEYLPRVYARADQQTGNGFLASWLDLVRTELGSAEVAIDDLPRWFDARTTPQSALAWLASWLGWEAPPGSAPEDDRRLLERAWDLYGRRGTLAGLREWIGVYTGLEPLVVERFHERHVWQLDQASLGLHTQLAPATPDGLRVPGFVVANPAWMGLLGSYYAGTDFDQLRFSRVDPHVDFDWGGNAPAAGMPADRFSVRWTGQVLPRYSETYAFETRSDDGVRLWIDGRLLIDDWHEHAERSTVAHVELTAGQWYSLRLDYYERLGSASIKLYWSSRSQAWEVVPQRQLYAVWDDTVSLDAPTPEAVLVGSSTVGEGRPQAAGDWGTALFADTAHLFSVLVPAVGVADPTRRTALCALLEFEKPAHTDYHLCVIEPRMRVGFQSRVGVDSYVAGAPPPMPLAGSVLGQDSVLGGEPGDQPGRVGQRARVGRDTVIG